MLLAREVVKEMLTPAHAYQLHRRENVRVVDLVMV